MIIHKVNSVLNLIGGCNFNADGAFDDVKVVRRNERLRKILVLVENKTVIVDVSCESWLINAHRGVVDFSHVGTGHLIDPTETTTHVVARNSISVNADLALPKLKNADIYKSMTINKFNFAASIVNRLANSYRSFVFGV